MSKPETIQQRQIDGVDYTLERQYDDWQVVKEYAQILRRSGLKVRTEKQVYVTWDVWVEDIDPESERYRMVVTRMHAYLAMRKREREEAEREAAAAELKERRNNPELGEATV